MIKNEIYKIKITGLTSEGIGVGRVDGMVVFVPYALPGETVSAKILKVCKNHVYAKMLDISEVSDDRTDTPCPVYSRCGGCGLRHMTYDAELRFKTDKVKQNLKRIGGIDIPVCNCVPSPKILAYRNKAQYPVREKDGTAVTGFFAKRTHDIIPADSCMIQSKFSIKVSNAVKKYMNKNGIQAYNEKTSSGHIRHIYVRNSKTEALLTIVTACTKLPYADKLTEIIKKECPFVCGIVQNINPDKTNVVLGGKNITLWGKNFLSDTLCGLNFEISPMSFYQVNHDQTENLYSCAASLADIKSNDTVLDLYCGIGTISLFMAKFAKHVYGVEIVPQAIENAKRNAEINNINNADFFVGDAASASEKFSNIDIVIIDPPRAGCAIDVINHIVRIAPKRLVYISCNPSTLARDLKIFSEKDYITTDVRPFDMFPGTEHVETVVQLVRKKPDAYIDITVDMDELDLTASEAKTTYKKIKEYIFEKHNVKVSSLYIAQVKQKYGIIERENYNKPSDENARQPKCPAEKEVFIEEALRHFKMIS